MSQLRDAYCGHAFVIETRREGEVWKGRFQLLADKDAQEQPDAEAQGLHRWLSMDDAWATELEAQTYAREAAHAAIDALH